MGTGSWRGRWLWLTVVVVALPRLAGAEVTIVHEAPRGDAPKVSHEPEAAAEQTPDGEAEDTDTDADTDAAADTKESGDRISRVATPTPQRGRSSRDIDAEIAALREERSQYGLGGPITLLAIGSGVFLTSAYLYVVVGAACPSRNCDADRSPFLVTGAIGAGLGIWGGVALGNRIGPRRDLGRRIHELERQKSGVDVSVWPVVAPSAAGLRLDLTF